MNEYLLKNFQMSYPHIASKVVDIHQGEDLELFMTLEDGSRMAYYEYDNSVRELPKDDLFLTEEECRKEFGIRLYRIMRHKGIMQKELSELTGITQASISNYINGRMSPTFFTVDKIARALGCSIEDLRYKF